MVNALVNQPLAERESSDEAQLTLVSSEFTELYQEHSRAVYYLALRLLGDPGKAEDATHDVFLKAFRNMGKFRREASWRTWLYRIAINHCRNLQQAWYDRHVFANADE
ncbi:MAG TPA: sigma-70 family RNA polymerase sigma factor, partial [Verrucomicrobiae bacterium]|nr:sigma-70 family RNA polymerase sigma factor [Verrucomicrobiae bacterium]